MLPDSDFEHTKNNLVCQIKTQKTFDINLPFDSVSNNHITFGKHFYKTIDELFETNKKYLVWCCLHVKDFYKNLNEEQLKQLNVVYLKDLSKRYVKDNKLTFGKYKGYELSELMKKSCSYLNWAMHHLEGFVYIFTSEERIYIYKQADIENISWYNRYETDWDKDEDKWGGWVDPGAFNHEMYGED